MQTEIRYRDITKSESLETFLLSRVEGLAEKYLKDDEASHLTIRLSSSRRRSQNRKPSFTCELILKPTHSRSVMKVKRTNEDFYTCVGEAVTALKAVLTHHASRRAENHRREQAPSWVVSSIPLLDEERENFQYVTEYAQS